MSRSCHSATFSTAALAYPAQHPGQAGQPLGELYLRGTSLANMLMTIVLVPVLVYMPAIMDLWLGPPGADAAIVAQILVPCRAVPLERPRLVVERLPVADAALQELGPGRHGGQGISAGSSALTAGRA